MKTKLIIGIITVILVVGGIWFFMGQKSSSQTASAPSYTLAQVASHKSESDCWAAINGKVYNLTSWINMHPGGPNRIIPLCGTDGSEAFNAQHGGERKPEARLAEFLIGELK